MATVSCPGCQQRDEEIADLKRRVAELEARLATNATNSGIPPSANPPDAPKLPPKKPTGKMPGAQPGHPAHLKRRLPPQRVNQFVTFVPQRCTRCREPLPPNPGPEDPEPTRHQVAELPEMAAHVTEYQGHFRTCPCCGAVNHAPVPQDLKAQSVGPRLAATLAYLAGSHHVSQRGLEEITEDVFDVPVALGTITNRQAQMSAALAPAHAEALEAVRAAAAKNVDETGWKEAGQKRWLWLAATATVAVFLIHARRSFAALKALLRRGVLWRKNAFGCHSAGGCRFVERLLTVVQTRRLQGRSVLRYLYQASVAHRNGLPAPSLLSAE